MKRELTAKILSTTAIILVILKIKKRQNEADSVNHFSFTAMMELFVTTYAGALKAYELWNSTGFPLRAIAPRLDTAYREGSIWMKDGAMRCRQGMTAKYVSHNS